MSEPANKPYDLAKTPLHLAPTDVVPIDGFQFDGPSFVAYTEKYCSIDEPHRLMFIEPSTEDWGAWECHQAGDEVVVIIEGEGVFFQELASDVAQIPFVAGDVIVNPKGVWHTADIIQPVRAIYLTPCPGTEHRPR